MLHRVFVDSDVLAARTAYDWLALLRHRTGAFQLHSSAGVVADSVRLWAQRDPGRRAAAPRRLDLLATSLDEVIGPVAPDLDLDAAVEPRSAEADAAVARANVLVSARGRGGATGDPLPFEIYTPDEFLCLVDDTACADVRQVTSEQRARRTRHAPASLADALTAAACPAFAARVGAHLDALAR
ncbi:hypothetical protein ACFC1I_07170 [Microbacterium sp. NPDC056044]|uniref:hypothetical protein n=1 Tax=Microbacterium sp. NPDC056044 TaxID=3345690 RepID=UPI0035D6BC33